MLTERHLILHFYGHLYLFTEKHKNTHKLLLLEGYSSSGAHPTVTSMILGA